jgi:hypothetical protein
MLALPSPAAPAAAAAYWHKEQQQLSMQGMTSVHCTQCTVEVVVVRYGMLLMSHYLLGVSMVYS